MNFCRSHEVLGGCSCLLIGDWGQLPPVMDLPLYTTTTKSELSDLGSANYRLFDCGIVLKQVIRQEGQHFQELLMRLRNGETTLDDWKVLMKQTPAAVENAGIFKDALHLFPTAAAVAEYNAEKLKKNSQPVARIEAIHSGPGASRIPASDAGGLEPVIYLACKARVMLTANLWVQVGLVNGALGTVVAICYDGADQSPPNLPVAVTVKFDSYTGPTLADGSVPIVPLRRTWLSSTHPCSRLQLPLKLAWAVTIHKSQGMTLDKVVIDVGKKEFSAGLTFVACSRVRHLKDLLFKLPFSFQRVAHLANCKRHKERLEEDCRLEKLSKALSANSNSCTDQRSRSEEAEIAETPTNVPHTPIPSSEEACVAFYCEDHKNVIANGSLPQTERELNISNDVVVTGVDTHAQHFHYNPVNEDWQRLQCERLGLLYCGPNGVTSGGSNVPLTRPTTFKKIIGDGNCLFRSFSLILTGSEEQHSAVRHAIIQHMRAIGDVLWPHQIAPLLRQIRNLGEVHLDGSVYADVEWVLGIEQYIAATRMDQDRAWGSEVEVMALAHLLDTPIYSYDTICGWNLYIPGMVHGTFNLSQTDTHQMALYLRHALNHYDVVNTV